MAFFPCVRFEAQIIMGFKGEMCQMKNWSEAKKLEYSMKLHDELHEFYGLVSMMAHISYKRKIKMIIENPWSDQHYLHRYWPIKPALIDSDRTRNGDYFKKPTQYWFLNCAPKQNLVFEMLEPVEVRTVENISKNRIAGKSAKTSRSMIHPQYTNRFIRQYILEE